MFLFCYFVFNTFTFSLQSSLSSSSMRISYNDDRSWLRFHLSICDTGEVTEVCHVSLLLCYICTLNAVSIWYMYIIQCIKEKTEPWNKGMLRPSSGVYDCSRTFILKYDQYAFEWYIVEIPPVMHHWAALFSKLNLNINLFHFMVGR